MYLIFGGAYQGKLAYAEKKFGKAEVCTCTEDAAEIDFSKDIIYRLEDFALACVRCRKEAKDYLKENREKLEGKILICADLSQGIVPIDPELRALREMTGRMMLYLADEAREVTRVFCGLGQQIKTESAPGQEKV